MATIPPIRASPPRFNRAFRSLMSRGPLFLTSCSLKCGHLTRGYDSIGRYFDCQDARWLLSAFSGLFELCTDSRELPLRLKLFNDKPPPSRRGIDDPPEISTRPTR